MGNPTAHRALSSLLSGRRTPEGLLRAGHLMSEGYPVELTFSSAAPNTARWTADVLSPTIAPGRRLGAVLGLLHGHGVSIPPSLALERLAAAQHAADLRFGAWLGGRHAPVGHVPGVGDQVIGRHRAASPGRQVAQPWNAVGSGRHSRGGAVGAGHGRGPRDRCALSGSDSGDRYKLYVDVARQRAAQVADGLDGMLGRATLPLAPAGLRFVGLDLGTGAVETYHRLDTDPAGAPVGTLRALLAATGLDHRAGDLLDAVADLTGWPIRDRLPIANLSASVSVVPGADAPTVAVFAHTVSVTGRDASTRTRLLAFARRRALDLGRYAEVSAGLAATPPARRHHSMITLAVGATGPVHLGIGLRPPDRTPLLPRLG